MDPDDVVAAIAAGKGKPAPVLPAPATSYRPLRARPAGEPPPLVFQAVALEAQPEDDDPEGIVGGVAVPYGRVAHLGWGWKIAIDPAAAIANLERRMNDAERDVLCLKAHDPRAVLGSTYAGTLTFRNTPTNLRYRAELDLEDPDGLSTFRKVARRDYRMASIGFAILAWETVQMVDDSPESESGEDEVSVDWATEIDIFEVSILAHGAYTTTSSRLAAASALAHVGAPGDYRIHVGARGLILDGATAAGGEGDTIPDGDASDDPGEGPPDPAPEAGTGPEGEPEGSAGGAPEASDMTIGEAAAIARSFGIDLAGGAPEASDMTIGEAAAIARSFGIDLNLPGGP